ncbi:MAG: thermonuclease family protein [SAR324 cluster bacterium]|nr:thermonuclease family protein [SAR324 cluster bacterium]
MNCTQRILLVIFLLSFVASVYALEGIPDHWIRFPIPDTMKTVVDGDTFKVDLNANGQYAPKHESIRLLFVDTPELSESHKGQDLKFGLPAKVFLDSLLNKKPLALWINPQNKYDKHQRLLAILEVRQQNGNLLLIREGHSYFDTRFGFPHNFNDYARAEALAFNRHRGIWSTSASRQRYLKRLQSEGKTIFSTQNPLFIPELLQAGEFAPKRFEGRFVRMEGQIKKIRNFNKGVQLYVFESSGDNEISVVWFEHQREMQGSAHLVIGDQMYAEGFVQLYKQRIWQIQTYRAWKISD